MDASGSGGLGDGEKGKNVRSRRSWTRIEEDALVLCLIEIVNNGWKSDNGFRAGFQRELEKGMRVLIPGTNLLATPHINSKIHQWKKDYGSLFDVLSKSGVGWNCTTHTLDVTDDGVWEAQQKADPHLKGMRFKSWPYFEQWQDIFGRDRATGEHAAAAINIVNDMLRYSQTGESASVDKFIKSSDDTFGSIAEKMGNEQEAKLARTTLNDLMKQISGLSLQDKIRVSDELVQNNNRLEYFLSLPPNEQAEYVIMLLDGRLK
ncbi:hypothetical protein ACS0TY_033435 [Phlomoides rotata]